MAIEVKHAKVSTKAEGDDPSQVRTSDWNAAHTVTGMADVLGVLAAQRRAGATAPESWYTGLMCLGGLTTLAMTASRLYVHPFLVAKGQTADRIAVCVTAAASSGKKARLGIYKNANAYPGDLEADLGEVTVDATGLRMVTINKALAPGLWWLAVVVEDAATVRALYHYYTLGIIGFPASGSTPSISYTSPTGYYMAHTYGALPASFAAYASATEITASACPAVFLRFSS